MSGLAPGPKPDYDPASWSLGYQTSQFGVGQDPAPSGVTAGDNTSTGVPCSIYAALASPPANMTTAIELALPAAPDITPTQ